MDKRRKDLKDYLEFLSEIKNFSPNTIKAYRQDIEQFIKWFEENNLSLLRDNIKDFLSDIYMRTKNKSTLSRKIYAIRSFFQFLMNNGRIDKNPFDVISVPKIEKKLPKILTESEMISFLNKLPEKSILEVRNKAIFELLYASGLRVSELTNLKKENINFRERLIRVFGKGKKVRIVPFNETAGDILTKYLRISEKKYQNLPEYIFLNVRGSKISDRGIEKILKKTFKEVCETNKNIYPHLFRHSFATHLLQRGVNLRVIQELLGHSNLSTTEKYTVLNYSDLLKSYNRFHPRSGKEES